MSITCFYFLFNFWNECMAVATKSQQNCFVKSRAISIIPYDNNYQINRNLSPRKSFGRPPSADLEGTNS